MELRESGGEGGIRTLGTGVSPYNGLANRRLQPLGHLSDVREFQFITVGMRAVAADLLSGNVAANGPLPNHTIGRPRPAHRPSVHGLGESGDARGSHLTVKI